jgi:hypothetical protein
VQFFFYNFESVVIILIRARKGTGVKLGRKPKTNRTPEAQSVAPP